MSKEMDRKLAEGEFEVLKTEHRNEQSTYELDGDQRSVGHPGLDDKAIFATSEKPPPAKGAAELWELPEPGPQEILAAAGRVADALLPRNKGQCCFH